ERPDRYPQDVDRPLSSRGRADAAAAGRWLADAGLVPDRVLCSPSVRTRETWQAAALALGEVPVVYESRLYLNGAKDVFALVRDTDATVSKLLVIGHNPTLSMLSRMLDPKGSTVDGLRTAGVAVHRVDGAWRGIEARSAPLTHEHTARG